ncbi:uncharacterized protein DUF4238 [Natrinema hispanicum]|uniref:Uncharacterized protein DUF4238 n=1 Tax=Natrinema hispanicum TaxID=392421 RepID=A0A482Y7H0_9EURY|nr:DUF4238 domain-containing protein [Natrinema hispanicum]RZV05078.1 uncharacterized protein DUF4238 [Natrinema hispanicum]
MPEKKNQHYVPKHYLRAWATDGKLNVLPLSAGKIFPDTTDSVCSRNYFYGNPPVVEDELANLDGYHAHPFRELRNGDDLTDLSQQRIELLLSFITTQRTRSRATKEDIEQGYDFLKGAVEDDMGADRYGDKIEWKDDFDEEEKMEKLVEAHLLGVHHFLIAQGIFGYIGIKDLDGVMLCNVTDQEFIVSDAPMVLDIPQYKHQLGLVPAGIGNRGLKIYCPVDQHRILLLYDPDVYRFDQNSKRQVLIKNEEVVDELNLLQFHNAESIVMFNGSREDYILDLYDRIDEVRRREEITTTRETEDMGEFEMEEAPAYQVPKISPDLPGCTPLDGVRYMKRRPASEIEKERQLVHTIFNEVNWASDIAVIYCIRLLEQLLDLQ